MKKWTKGEIILSDLLIALAFVYIVPFLMMILGSFKAQSQAAMFNLELPKQWLISNYAHVLESGKILRGYLNSAIITIPVTVLSVLFGAVAGVVISRRNDRVTRGLYYYFIFGLTLTLQIASIFFLLKVLNIYGTFFSVICIFISLRIPFTVMTFYSFVKGVPRDIDEAAIIDGCSPMGCFFKMVVPMSLNSIITVATMQAVFCWNEYINAYTFTRSTDMKTITLGLNDFVGSMGLTDWGATFAAITVTVLPVFIFYFFSSKKMLAGMTAGAVKG